MFLYSIKGFDVNVPSEMLKLATPFGGGIGTCEDTCGVLISAMMVVGMKYGRENLNGNKRFTYKIAKRFYEWFRSEFGTTNCYELNHGEYNTPEHKERCGKYIIKTLEFLDKLFEEIDASEK